VSARVVGPLVEQYGDDLVIMGLNVNSPGGSEFYTAAMEELQIPDERRVIPFMLIGEHALVGSEEIGTQLADIVAEGFASGGIGWPEVAGLDTLYADAEATLQARTPAAQTAAAETASAPTPVPGSTALPMTPLPTAAPRTADPGTAAATTVGATASVAATASVGATASAAPIGPLPASSATAPTVTAPAAEPAPVRDPRVATVLLVVVIVVLGAGLAVVLRRQA